MTKPLAFMTPALYKAGKLYSQIGQDWDVDRNSTATYVDRDGLLKVAAANVPRLDFSGGVSCPALLVEGEATNMIVRSQELNDAYWTKNNSTIGVNIAVSPDGTSTADNIIANSSLGINANITRALISFTNNSQVTFSVFLKQNGFNWSRVRIFDRRNSIGYNQFINLSNGILGVVPSGLTASVVPFISGWYRLILTLPVVAGTAQLDVFIGSAANDGFVEVNGNGVLGILAWGMQLESAGSASSHIPTTGSAVTRLADIITKPDEVGATVTAYERESGEFVEEPTTGTAQFPEGRFILVKQQ